MGHGLVGEWAMGGHPGVGHGGVAHSHEAHAGEGHRSPSITGGCVGVTIRWVHGHGAAVGRMGHSRFREDVLVQVVDGLSLRVAVAVVFLHPVAYVRLPVVGHRRGRISEPKHLQNERNNIQKKDPTLATLSISKWAFALEFHPPIIFHSVPKINTDVWLTKVRLGYMPKVSLRYGSACR